MSDQERTPTTPGSFRPSGRVLAVGACVIGFLLIPLPASAHGLGGLSNLPGPLSYFLSGVATVLITAFALLTWRWPHPRWQEEPSIRRLEVPGWRWIVMGLRAFGVGGLVLVVVAGLLGPPNSVRNPGPVLVWVGFWLLVPICGGLLGDVYRLINPWRSLAKLVEAKNTQSGQTSRALGIWPATLTFVAFVWFEVIYPNPAHPRHLAVAAIFYTLLLLGIAAWQGPKPAIEQWDAFTTYNRVISAIAPVDLDPERGPGWRGWLRGLPFLPESAGMTTFVIAMIGTVAFHGMSSASWYQSVFGAFGTSTGGSTMLLLSTVGVVAATFLLVCAFVARQGQPPRSIRLVARSFSHVLVPIGFALVFAHYLTVVVFEGQLLLSGISDPLGLGWDLFGTAGRPVDFTVLSTFTVWWIQVVAIAVGHLAALTLIHDRALRDFDGPGGVRARYGLLLLVIVSAGIGLTILATG